MDDKSQTLIAAFQEKQLLDAIMNLLLARECLPDTLGPVLSKLHNQGDIDLVKTYSSTNKFALRSRSLLRKVFKYALPTLKAQVGQVTVCVKHVVDTLGERDPYKVPTEELTKFLSADDERPGQAFQLWQESPGEWADYTRAILGAGMCVDMDKYVRHAIELIDHKIPRVSEQAIVSLIQTPAPVPSSLAEQAIEKMLDLSETRPDNDRMDAMMLAVESLEKQGENNTGDIS